MLLDKSQGTTLLGYPHYYVILSKGQLKDRTGIDEESENRLRIWKLQDAYLDNEEVEMEIFPNPKGLIALKNEEGKVCILSYNEIIEKVAIAIKEGYAQSLKEGKERWKSKNKFNEEGLEKDLLNRRNVLRMNVEFQLKKIKDSQSYSSMRKLQPKYWENLKLLQEFDEDYPEYSDEKSKKRYERIKDEDEIQAEFEVVEIVKRMNCITLILNEEIEECRVKRPESFHLIMSLLFNE